MTVHQAIMKRRAYRQLESVEITDKILEQLGTAAQLAPSCFNNQPWRFIFVRNKEILGKMFDALSPGNAWGKNASLIIVVFGKKEDDCVIKDREYYLFDLGLAAYAVILQATELDLVAHPIAGFSPEKVKEITGIPGEYTVITLILVGTKAGKEGEVKTMNPGDTEEIRPERRPLSQIWSLDVFHDELQ